MSGLLRKIILLFFSLQKFLISIFFANQLDFLHFHCILFEFDFRAKKTFFCLLQFKRDTLIRCQFCAANLQYKFKSIHNSSFPVIFFAISFINDVFSRGLQGNLFLGDHPLYYVIMFWGYYLL